MNTRLLVLLVVLTIPVAARAQHTHEHDRAITFPDVPGYQTLEADLHLHTVFSDGAVWPTIRVEEAIRDSLDVIAITDHIEYQPHQDDIPHPDRNRSYALAAEAADGHDLIVISGSEITRSMPPGHANAIFVEDANALLQDDPVAVFREAARQGAFIFWNHPMWTAHAKTGMAELTEMHRELIGEGLLHGIEVVNELTYSDEALQIALDHDLTIIGTSDIHGLIDWQYEVASGGHRPVTLVFATERSKEGIKEALMEGRTAVWFDEILIGKEAFVVPLIEASLDVERAAYQGDALVLDVWIRNTSDAEYLLQNRGEHTFHANADLLRLDPHETTRLQVKTLERVSSLELAFEVLNAVVAPEEHPVVTLEVEVEVE